jgi:hypothetical protein
MDNWVGCLFTGGCSNGLCGRSYGCKAALFTVYILVAGLMTLLIDYMWSI